MSSNCGSSAIELGLSLHDSNRHHFNYLSDTLLDIRGRRRQQVEPQQRFGIRRSHVEPPAAGLEAQIDREAVKTVVISVGKGGGDPFDDGLLVVDRGVDLA